jgi:hypothetical protein
MQRGGCRISCKTKAEPITLGPFKRARASAISGLVLDANFRFESLDMVAGEGGKTSASSTTFLINEACAGIAVASKALAI